MHIFLSYYTVRTSLKLVLHNIFTLWPLLSLWATYFRNDEAIPPIVSFMIVFVVFVVFVGNPLPEIVSPLPIVSFMIFFAAFVASAVNPFPENL